MEGMFVPRVGGGLLATEERKAGAAATTLYITSLALPFAFAEQEHNNLNC